MVMECIETDLQQGLHVKWKPIQHICEVMGSVFKDAALLVAPLAGCGGPAASVVETYNVCFAHMGNTYSSVVRSVSVHFSDEVFELSNLCVCVCVVNCTCMFQF